MTIHKNTAQVEPSRFLKIQVRVGIGMARKNRPQQWMHLQGNNPSFTVVVPYSIMLEGCTIYISCP